ncbi:hypothetical protein V8E53_002351 [Lactarius tabidus]
MTLMEDAQLRLFIVRALADASTQRQEKIGVRVGVSLHPVEQEVLPRRLGWISMTPLRRGIQPTRVAEVRCSLRKQDAELPDEQGDRNKTDRDSMQTRSLAVNRYPEQQVHRSRSESDDGMICAAIFPSTPRTSREDFPAPSSDGFIAILPPSPGHNSVVAQPLPVESRTFDERSPQPGRRDLSSDNERFRIKPRRKGNAWRGMWNPRSKEKRGGSIPQNLPPSSTEAVRGNGTPPCVTWASRRAARSKPSRSRGQYNRRKKEATGLPVEPDGLRTEANSLVLAKHNEAQGLVRRLGKKDVGRTMEGQAQGSYRARNSHGTCMRTAYMRKFDEVIGNDISSSGSKVLSAFTEGPLTDARLAQPERNRATNVRRLRLLEANLCSTERSTIQGRMANSVVIERASVDAYTHPSCRAMHARMVFVAFDFGPKSTCRAVRCDDDRLLTPTRIRGLVGSMVIVQTHTQLLPEERPPPFMYQNYLHLLPEDKKTEAERKSSAKKTRQYRNRDICPRAWFGLEQVLIIKRVYFFLARGLGKHGRGVKSVIETALQSFHQRQVVIR